MGVLFFAVVGFIALCIIEGAHELRRRGVCGWGK